MDAPPSNVFDLEDPRDLARLGEPTLSLSAHRLLGLDTSHDLAGHPKVGASWEGFVIEQLLMLDVKNPWFWATHGGAEIDLLVDVDGRRVGIEVKRTDRPPLTPSMRHALVDLDLDRLVVVHAGEHRFTLAPNVTAIGAKQLLSEGMGAVSD